MKTPRRLAVVMDPIAHITYAKDSTLAMLIAAQARGFELSTSSSATWRLRDGKRVRTPAAAQRARRSTVLAHARRAVRRPLGEFDCILMRKDPPFDMEYIYSTYILERAQDQGALVVNRRAACAT
jgi:glutathione synthase